MFGKLFNKNDSKKPVTTEDADEKVADSKPYSIYLKTQFGKLHCIDGLNDKSTIMDVKHRLENIAGVAFSKMRLTSDQIAKRLGVPMEEYQFPDKVPLKKLGIKDGEVLIWKAFHQKYMKEVPSKILNEYNANKGKSGGFGFRSRSDNSPYWTTKINKKPFVILMCYQEIKDDEKEDKWIATKDKKFKYQLKIHDLTLKTNISDIIQYIKESDNKIKDAIDINSIKLYMDRDLSISKLHYINPSNIKIDWTQIWNEYTKKIKNMIEKEQEDILYEANYKAFEEKNDEQGPAADTIISIDKLLEKDEETVATFGECLEARGWCLIKYPENITNIIETVCKNVFKALENKNNGEIVKGDKWEKICYNFGYNEFKDYKQVLRVLTGDLLNYHIDKYPLSVTNDLEIISKTMDKLTINIINSTLNHKKVWNIESLQEFKEKCPVSIVNGWENNEKMKSGMIDFVEYYNKKEDEKAKKYPMFGRGINVESHTDPGIFSLSFLSTSPGLELYDISTSKWVSAPTACGVLWCGEAAPRLTDGRIKSGIHRVTLNKNGKERFTSWYEASHHNQISKQIIDQALNPKDTEN